MEKFVTLDSVSASDIFPNFGLCHSFHNSYLGLRILSSSLHIYHILFIICHSCLVSLVNNANNLVPNALFHGFGGGASECPHLQSQGKAPWGRGCNQQLFLEPEWALSP